MAFPFPAGAPPELLAPKFMGISLMLDLDTGMTARHPLHRLDADSLKRLVADGLDGFSVEDEGVHRLVCLDMVVVPWTPDDFPVVRAKAGTTFPRSEWPTVHSWQRARPSRSGRLP